MNRNGFDCIGFPNVKCIRDTNLDMLLELMALRKIAWSSVFINKPVNLHQGVSSNDF